MSTPPNTLTKQDNDNSYTPSGPSSLTSARGALHHKSSKESIQSHQTSLSNFSTHTAPSAVYKDREDLLGQGRRPHTSRHHASDPFRGQNFSVSDLTILILSRNRPFLSKTNHSPMHLLPLGLNQTVVLRAHPHFSGFLPFSLI
jgi:hypothetical protein